MTIPFDDLFETLGKAFAVQSAANTARGTTLPTAVDGLLTQFNSLDPDATLEAAATGIPSALSGGQSGLSSLLTGIQTFCSQYLIATVNADNPQANRTLPTALAELIKQMKAASETVDASTPGVSVAYGSSNIGTGKLIFSTKRGDGLVQENIIPETILARVSGNGQTASIVFTGQQAAPSLLDHNWPDGSGVSTTITSVSAASSILANGDMEDEDDIANSPDDWTVEVGTIGTTIKMTDVAVQTVIISGTPTSGYYRLKYSSDGDDATRVTGLIAYNADATAVQAALRTIPGLELVTVTSTGTTPNFTHTITFTGRGGNLSNLSSTNTFDTGSIAHNTTTFGSDHTFAGGKSVEFDSNGSQLVTIYQRVTSLQPLNSYAVSLWGKHDVAPAAGTMIVELVKGDGSDITDIIEDEQGVPNSFAFNVDDLTSWKHCTEVVEAVNEQQTLTITGTPTGGSFTLYYDGQTTGAIAYNANAAAVQSALEALSNINVGDVTCSGGAFPGTPVVVTFTGRLAARAIGKMIAVASFTGGTAPAITITVSRPGSTAEPVFRTPSVLPSAIYLRIRTAIAISSGTSLFLDDVAMAAMRALYTGGPMFAAFSPANVGPKVLSGGKSWAEGDSFTITVSNDRAGAFQEWFNRNFNMTSLSLLLPSDTAGNETILDSLIA